MLFFDEEQKRERRERLNRICDVNAAFAGGKAAEKLLKALE